jgi:hypothetical protein
MVVTRANFQSVIKVLDRMFEIFYLLILAVTEKSVMTLIGYMC